MFDTEIKRYIERHGFEAFAPKAVLFDMDGVLYNSMPNHASCWVDSMAEFGIKMKPMDAYTYEGMRGVETIQLLVKQQQKRDISEAEAQEMYDEKTRLFGLLPKAKIMDGVVELMKKIKKSGLKIGIVTGSGQKPLISRLIHDFQEFVNEDDIVTAYDVKHGKPAPDPYLMGLEKMDNLHPWEAIVVENAPLGVRSGVAANIFTVAVNSGPLPNSALADEGANLVFDEMPDFCKAWNCLIENFSN